MISFQLFPYFVYINTQRMYYMIWGGILQPWIGI